MGFVVPRSRIGARRWRLPTQWPYPWGRASRRHAVAATGRSPGETNPDQNLYNRPVQNGVPEGESPARIEILTGLNGTPNGSNRAERSEVEHTSWRVCERAVVRLPKRQRKTPEIEVISGVYIEKSTPNGSRTRVSAVRGRCPWPLDDGSKDCSRSKTRSRSKADGR